MSEFFSQEGEIAILSILLNNPDMAYDTTSKPFMFNSTANQLIFSCIQDLAQKNFVPETALVVSHLNSENKLNNAGGQEYISYLKTQNYKKENLKEYERQVSDSYRTRRLISVSSDINDKALKGNDIGFLLSEFRKNIDQIEEASGEDNVSSFYDASSEAWDRIVERVQNPGIRGIPTGYSELDTPTGGYNEGDLWIIAGRPGMGKTAQMCNASLHVARALKERGEGVLIFSLEMNKTQLVERMLSIESGVPLADIRLGALNQTQLDQVSNAIKAIKDLPIYIDTNYGADEHYFASTVRKYKKLRNIRIAFFDYIQLATDRDENQTAALGSFSRIAKLLANDLAITVVLYSQLNRAVENREDKHPQLSDLRQSGNLEEDADLVMFLYRDEYYNNGNSKYKGVVEQDIRKHRNGPPGSLFFNFDSTNLRISSQRSK